MIQQSFVWEDKDIILEYKSINLKNLKKIDFFQVPVDNVTRNEAMAKLLSFLEKKEKLYYVLFLDPLKLMRILPNKKYSYLNQSDLILVEGKGIQWATKKLGTPVVERIPRIAFLMDLFRLAHKNDYTIYFVGSKQEYLEKIFVSLTRNLPGLRIIGKHSKNFTKEKEEKIKLSLRKTNPDIVLIGMGFPKQEKWIYQNQEFLNHAVVIGMDDAFEILAGVKKYPEMIQYRGLEWFWNLLKKPYRVDLWWRAFRFYVKVMFYSLFKKIKFGTKVSSN